MQVDGKDSLHGWRVHLSEQDHMMLNVVYKPQLFLL